MKLKDDLLEVVNDLEKIIEKPNNDELLLEMDVENAARKLENVSYAFRNVLRLKKLLIEELK